MDFNKVNEKLLNKFDIKPCRVKLQRIAISDIRISCSEQTTMENIDLKWSLTQENPNTFSLKIKRTLCNDGSDDLPAQKRIKFNQVAVNHCSGIFL